MPKAMKGSIMENANTCRSAHPNSPHYLLAYRTVKHFYSEVVRANVVSSNISSSLGYQMQQSIKDLMDELKGAGRDYELFLRGGYHGDDLNRWEFFVNGEHLATIDRDYGFDCFDISATHFKDTMATLLELSDIAPLTELERSMLDAQRRVNRILAVLAPDE